MRTKLLIGAALAVLHAGPAAAEMPLYAYGGVANYCPNGLRPIVAGGIICCGVPNQSISYQQANAHPVRKAKKRVVRRVAETTCPEGMKGCYTQ